MIVDYDPIEYRRRPDLLESVRDSYGILVTGDSMIPIVLPGDVLLINPHLPPKVNRVAVFYRSFLGETTATVKTFMGQTERVWKVKRWHPKELEFTLDRAEWQHCHPRIGVYDAPG